VKVYGKEGRDEEFRPFAVTQYTTVEELMEMVKSTMISRFSFVISLILILDCKSK